ncbi:helix-turn-helix domain-containing protein [Enterococcus wangshanyuanii]|uniref:HTH cro/C1-type domain-containing protein n=1 Tax=Enterococcus wangshanyuanii TaxID=2005703 RepID=A0ABQ1PVU0_9ENTE|nr:helix-turn-helix transcriptional regulator [Enterococcus wangshanyuanii]GGD04831.1 hypothetical protein GCM10011573_37910 [Enterococcus wangshanyuanii]
MTVFERIKFLSKKRGKSLNEVEEDLGLSKNVLYRMKQSDNPTKERLEILADYFDVSVDYLLGRTNQPQDYYFSDASINSIKKIYEGTDTNYLTLLEKLQQLDDDEIQALENMADVMIAKKNKS